MRKMALLCLWFAASSSAFGYEPTWDEIEEESQNGEVVTFCTCDAGLFRTDLVLNVVNTRSGEKTKHVLEKGFSSKEECKKELKENPACLK